MQCIRPIKAGFDHSGSIVFSTTLASKELASFEFPCRKCLPCRLNIASEKAIRAIHESQMHDDSIFLTLTYNEESLRSPRLCYPDFQLFMKRLLEKLNRNITDKDNRIKVPYMVTGEYGELNKRPHWHAILFNYRPSDAKPKYKTDRGDQVWSSDEINSLWDQGATEFGSVTIESAGYVARYAAKKLVHGKDQDHDFHPIHKTSSKHAIGKKWIEKHFNHVFSNGFITLPNGSTSKIPRYYVDWCKKNHPEIYMSYVSDVLPRTIAIAEAKKRSEELNHFANIANYKGGKYPLLPNQVKNKVLERKFKTLQERLKL